MNVKFGTDGARDPFSPDNNAGPGFITPETGFRIGAAAGALLGNRWVIGRDTRSFNEVLTASISEGLVSAGASVVDLGVMPTPAAALIASQQTRTTGINHNAISVSASHNPAEDAGIKVFGADGKKLNDADTKILEKMANELVIPSGPHYVRPTNEFVRETLRRNYIDMVLSTVSPELRNSKFLDGKKIVVDAANGAAYWTAPEIISNLGALVVPINCDLKRPINENSGSEHPEQMVEAVETHEAFYGVSTDGDADRATAYVRGLYPNAGRLLDGDDAIAIAVQRMIHEGRVDLTAVVTAYTSWGFEEFMRSLGVRLEEVDNGDRYILEAFDRSSPDVDQPYNGYEIGGEQSGHNLFPLLARDMDRVLTGDGIITALQELQTSAILGKSLLELSGWDKGAYLKGSVKLPKGTNANQILELQSVAETIEENALMLGNRGRLHIRGSGTQPVIRILSKGSDEQPTKEAYENVSTAIQKAVA